jgi:hypothetical protein
MMEERSGSFVPSRLVVEKLSEYANLLAKYGPRSPQAAEFYEKNAHLSMFPENAQDLQQLEQEDWDLRA